MNNPQHSRALSGTLLGLSISESTDAGSRGFDTAEVNRTSERVCRALLAQGAGLVFGHDWRPEGVMERVLWFAQGYQGPSAGAPLLVNLVPWPDQPTLSHDERAFLGDTLLIETGRLPDALGKVAEERLRKQPEIRPYLRARGLTQLRRDLIAKSNARLCIGGKTEGYQGRLPGIVEEALFALEADQPLYVSGLFGGASAHVIAALCGDPMPPDAWKPADDVVNAWAAFAPSLEPNVPDAQIDPDTVWKKLNGIGLSNLAGRDGNGLTEQENKELFQATSVSTVIDWVITGLARLRAQPRP